MVVLLLSVCPLLDHRLLHLYYAHMIDLPMYWPQASTRTILVLDQNFNYAYQKGSKGHAPLLVSLATDNPT